MLFEYLLFKIVVTTAFVVETGNTEYCPCSDR